ncbi:MAG: MoaD/ThiS family protein [Alcaligenaceae bacterium]|jgi:molybdopterin synthase sulfur carrier subunit|nr:MoaD/ThiS family protein [Alcaligenaceae bacterium]
MLTINYMAKLREELDCSTEQIEWQGGTVDELLDFLRQRGEPWQSTLSAANVYKVAINNEIVHDTSAQLAPDAVVALLPPVTGG